MRSLVLILTCKLFLFISCVPPEMNRNNNLQNRTIFADGIYLENIGVTIPWEIRFSEISKYGNPKIIAFSRIINHVTWDSVVVLGVNANLTIHQNKLIRPDKTVRLSIVYITINAADIEKLKTYFEAYTQKPGNLTSQKNNMYYYWWIDGCNIRLGNGKYFGNYLWVQKNYKR